MDLSDLIDRHAAFTPGKTAIRFQGRTLTYATFAARIAAAARALKSRLGIGRGDRVAILSTNHPDFLVLLYACARLGAVLVPLNWRLAVPEQLFILTDASVKALVVEEGFAAVIAPLMAALPDARVIGLDFGPADGTSFE
ncbi:MAG: AMP-binding protein, partial [Xanthobacteraceae bacterium]